MSWWYGGANLGDDERRRSLLNVGDQQSSKRGSLYFGGGGASAARRGAAGKAPSPRPRASERFTTGEQRAARRKAAFEEMFVTYRRSFLSVAGIILRNLEDAEDAVQNAFLSRSARLD